MCVSHQMGRVMPTNEKEILLFLPQQKFCVSKKVEENLDQKILRESSFLLACQGVNVESLHKLLSRLEN